jgi:hypothetical protein
VKILFFAPYSALWIHAYPEALVAQALKEAGHEVVYVTCGNLYQRYCVAMNAAGLSVESPLERRARVCRDCNAHKNLLRDRFDFPGADLTTWLRQDDHVEIERTTAAASREALLEWRVDQVPVGRLALYEFLLEHKKQSFDFSDAEWEGYLVALRHALLTARAMGRVLDEHRPDRIVVYNALYSVNRTSCQLAERRGIPSFFLHAGGNLSNRLQTLMVGRHHTFAYFTAVREAWSRFASRPVPGAIQQQVTNHFEALLKGHHFLAYSAQKDAKARSVRQRYGVPAGAKLLTATLSSYDERFAAETVGAIPVPGVLLFPKQVDWIRALIEFVRHRSDLFLLVRVHPREFPNRRESIKSEHAKLLEAELSRLPPNARVNWPDDRVSLYEIAEEADLFLNAWSSVGKEMSLFGLPVLIYAEQLVSYPPELNFLGHTREEYLAKIDEALASGWSIERVRMMYRWYALEFAYSLVDMSDGYPAREESSSLWARIARRLRRSVNPYYLQQADCRRRYRLRAGPLLADIIVNARASVLESPLLNLANGTSQEEEGRALRAEFMRLARTLGRPSRLNRVSSLGARFAKAAKGIS